MQDMRQMTVPFFVNGFRTVLIFNIHAHSVSSVDNQFHYDFSASLTKTGLIFLKPNYNQLQYILIDFTRLIYLILFQSEIFGTVTFDLPWELFN